MKIKNTMPHGGKVQTLGVKEAPKSNADAPKLRYEAKSKKEHKPGYIGGTPNQETGEVEARNTLKLKCSGKTFQVKVRVSYYTDNGNLGVWLTHEENGIESPFGKLTVNLESICDEWYAFIDTNNLPDDVVKWIAANKLAAPTGKFGASGYCTYPLYHFNPEVLQKLDPEGCAAYRSKFTEPGDE